MKSTRGGRGGMRMGIVKLRGVCLNYIFGLESLRELTAGYKVDVEGERVGCLYTEMIDAKVYRVTIEHHRSR
jgi:hypothetical protein